MKLILDLPCSYILQKKENIILGTKKLSFKLNFFIIRHRYILLQLNLFLLQELQRQRAGGLLGSAASPRLLHHAGRLREVREEQPRRLFQRVSNQSWELRLAYRLNNQLIKSVGLPISCWTSPISPWGTAVWTLSKSSTPAMRANQLFSWFAYFTLAVSEKFVRTTATWTPSRSSAPAMRVSSSTLADQSANWSISC